MIWALTLRQDSPGLLTLHVLRRPAVARPELSLSLCQDLPCPSMKNIGLEMTNDSNDIEYPMMFQ